MKIPIWNSPSIVYRCCRWITVIGLVALLGVFMTPLINLPMQHSCAFGAKKVDKKGDIYSDLWVILRDSDTGVPILDENGYVQPAIQNDDGTIEYIQLTEDGEVPPEYVDAIGEVEFGRLSIGRSPSQVFDHALNEALSKLIVAEDVGLDLAGRLVIDPLTAAAFTIDSPLENLALYKALITDDPALEPVAEKLAVTEKFSLAASLLAASADKTGTITTDLVAYENIILGIAAMTADDYVHYDNFCYNRDTTYPDSISYYALIDGNVVLVTEDIVDAVFDGEGYGVLDCDEVPAKRITDFAQAADDALQIIEFIHTQIH